MRSAFTSHQTQRPLNRCAPHFFFIKQQTSAPQQTIHNIDLSVRAIIYGSLPSWFPCLLNSNKSISVYTFSRSITETRLINLQIHSPLFSSLPPSSKSKRSQLSGQLHISIFSTKRSTFGPCPPHFPLIGVQKAHLSGQLHKRSHQETSITLNHQLLLELYRHQSQLKLFQSRLKPPPHHKQLFIRIPRHRSSLHNPKTLQQPSQPS